MDGVDSWHGAFRIELRAEAISLAWRGWPVLPGTYPSGPQQWVGREGTQTAGPSPAHADWADRIGTPPAQVANWWSGEPYSLLVATGLVLDAVEVDAQLGRRTAALLRSIGVVTPIAATPNGRWLFFTTVGHGPHADLVHRDEITLHGKGSWIPLPPTPYEHGIAHWRVKPEICSWQLPNGELVQDAVTAALGGRSELALVGMAAQLLDSERLSA